VGRTPVVVREAARALVGVRPTTDVFADVGRRVAEAVEPESDLHASRDYRTHLAGVLTRRALARASERAARPR
jgi:CO/xanthine dehydrogenase FAD-binding subunit